MARRSNSISSYRGTSSPHGQEGRIISPDKLDHSELFRPQTITKHSRHHSPYGDWKQASRCTRHPYSTLPWLLIQKIKFSSKKIQDCPAGGPRKTRLEERNRRMEKLVGLRVRVKMAAPLSDEHVGDLFAYDEKCGTVAIRAFPLFPPFTSFTSSIHSMNSSPKKCPRPRLFLSFHASRPYYPPR